MTGANSAAATSRTMNAAPTTGVRPPSSRTMNRSRIANPWIGGSGDEICEQIAHGYQNARDDDGRRRPIVVECLHGAHCEEAHAAPSEDVFDEEGAAENRRKEIAEDGDGGRQCVSERVAREDDARSEEHTP